MTSLVRKCEYLFLKHTSFICTRRRGQISLTLWATKILGFYPTLIKAPVCKSPCVFYCVRNKPEVCWFESILVSHPHQQYMTVIALCHSKLLKTWQHWQLSHKNTTDSWIWLSYNWMWMLTPFLVHTNPPGIFQTKFSSIMLPSVSSFIQSWGEEDKGGCLKMSITWAR